MINNLNLISSLAFKFPTFNKILTLCDHLRHFRVEVMLYEHGLISRLRYNLNEGSLGNLKVLSVTLGEGSMTIPASTSIEFSYLARPMWKGMKYRPLTSVSLSNNDPSILIMVSSDTFILTSIQNDNISFPVRCWWFCFLSKKNA